jgi:hypothetical protein
MLGGPIDLERGLAGEVEAEHASSTAANVYNHVINRGHGDTLQHRGRHAVSLDTMPIDRGASPGGDFTSLT